MGLYSTHTIKLLLVITPALVVSDTLCVACPCLLHEDPPHV